MHAKKGKRRMGLVIFLLLLAIGGYLGYVALLKPNIYLDGKKYKFIYIHNRDTYADVIAMLEEENILQDKKTFEWLAKAYDMPENFKPGRYRVIAGMTNRQLINMINKGKQEKVKLSFNAADRTDEDIIKKITEKLDINEDELERFFNEPNGARDKFNLDNENLRCLFLPETYELNWNTSLPELMDDIEQTYTSFWNANRKQKAAGCGLTLPEVETLASIVQSESAIGDEQRKIAGVYINRLKKNMPLQADPTLIFARGDFSIQRVRSGDKDIDSPYNTYRNKGLPPGPICLPYKQAIDAVLNYNRHSFLYFCAKPDLNGYSNYSVSYEDHQKYADAYQKEMNRRGINR